MSTQTTVHHHAYQHFEDLQMSSNEFYDILENLIKEYQYPEVICTKKKMKEAGVFSAKRVYLCINRELFNYYVCAAPFGKSFFISWWFEEKANTAANVVEKMPLFGKALSQKMENKTFYELDTQLMFTQSIQAIIKTAVAKVMADKVLRQPVAAN